MERMKQKIIKLIRKEIRDTIWFFQAEGDADVEIIKDAVNNAQKHSTTICGEHTDLLFLLLYYVEASGNPLYFRSNNKSRCIAKCIKSII